MRRPARRALICDARAGPSAQSFDLDIHLSRHRSPRCQVFRLQDNPICPPHSSSSRDEGAPKPLGSFPYPDIPGELRFMLRLVTTACETNASHIWKGYRRQRNVPRHRMQTSSEPNRSAIRPPKSRFFPCSRDNASRALDQPICLIFRQLAAWQGGGRDIFATPFAILLREANRS